MSDPKIAQKWGRPVKTYHTETYERIATHHGFQGKGKTVLVTGGATGIGYQISKAFAKAGVRRIVLVARSAERMEKAKAELSAAYPETDVLTYSASITDLRKIKEILDEVRYIDVLILNAAYFQAALQQPNGMPKDDIQNSFDTNVVASFEFVREFLKLPPTSGRRTVLNVSTAAALHTFPGFAAYGASKQAFSFMFQHFALQEVVSGKPIEEQVRFINLHPGVIPTEAAKATVPEGAFEWEDINLPADFSLWLCGPESDFLHGRFVWAQWDVDELIALKERVEKEPAFLTIGLVQ